uniref:Kinetochore associated 1 n=1 Tax=Oncorhynchus mykiss TaxID=8022 RepID=A0A8K9XYX7_ONCMY
MWNDVELLINEDTNTGRLCNVREENSGLYQVDTLVKIASTEKLYSSSSSNCSIVVADSTVILFDLSYQTMLLHLDFDSDVDTVDDCLDGHFLVVCQRNGNLHLIYVPQKSTLLTIVRDGADLICPMIFQRLNVSVSYVCQKCLHAECNIFFCIHFFFFTLLGFLGYNIILNCCVLMLQSNFALICIVGVRKILVVDNLMYVLSTENILSLWDLHFLVMVCCWPDLSIHDFLLITECDSASIATYVFTSITKIITLTMSLQVRSLPSMTVLYSLEVSSTACLVQTRISTDTIYLLEGIYENSQNSEEHISSVVMRCFTEALPENRLSRLLYKHKFEEAEKFAIAFELDVELVYKVKLDFVLEQLASASVGGNGQDVWSDLVEEAKTNLMKIMDEQYVVEYCLKAPWPTFDTAEKMLNHARKKMEKLRGLNTFLIHCLISSWLFPSSGISWIEFLNITDYVGDMLSHLREGDLKGAQHLWLRHEFDERGLDALLSSFPEDLPSQDLCLWLRSVIVPFVRRVVPRGQKIVARWLEQRARILELTEKGDWPQNGLNLAELGLPSLWMWIPSEDDYGSEEVEHLKSLVSNLRQLLDLYNKYNCRLSLSVFEKASIRSVAFLMLDKVPAPELISATVEGSVRPYSLEHQLPLDELLLQYIKDLLERCSSQTTTLFTEWEAKAVAVLGCITDTDCYIYLSQLEDLNIPYTVESFLNSPKEGMVKGLWKNHSHEPQAVRLVADLSLEYQVFDPQLWNGLLQKLLGFNMISDLQKVLEALGAVPSLWQVITTSADSSFILHVPLIPASSLVSGRCPFLLNLDLIGIANRFAQFSLPGFALGALLLIPCAKRKGQQIQGLLSACNPITILEQLDEHMNTGELAGVPSQIRDTVLMFICQNRQYQKLWKTKHFNLLKQHIVSSGDSNQVKNLVDYLISHSW